MRIVEELTAEHRGYWSDLPETHEVTMKSPEGMDDCGDCPAIWTYREGHTEGVVRVAWKPDEIDLAHLAKGGTIWLSTWGGLPPHMLEVQPAEGGARA